MRSQFLEISVTKLGHMKKVIFEYTRKVKFIPQSKKLVHSFQKCSSNILLLHLLNKHTGLSHSNLRVMELLFNFEL